MDDTVRRALRSGAVLVAEPERPVLAISGPDRTSWLNGVVTCDVAAVTPGRAAFGLLLSKQGKIQTEFYAVAAPGRILLCVAPGTGEVAKDELERMLVMEDAELADVTAELAGLSLHGPRAAAVAEAGTSVGFGALDRTGLGGAVLVVRRPALAEVVAELEVRGATRVDAAAWSELRVLRQLGQFGVDYGTADNPHEAALDRAAVAWNKGCYLGQEVVFMQDARGKLKRRLSLVELDGPAPARGTKVLAEGQEVGELTTVATNASGAGSLGLARLKAPFFEPGTVLRVGEGAAVVRGEAVELEPDPRAAR